MIDSKPSLPDIDLVSDFSDLNELFKLDHEEETDSVGVTESGLGPLDPIKAPEIKR
jgi:hypothetical protein